MPIEGFGREDKKVKHVVDVRIGGVCPTGCKFPLIFHESPDDNKCTNEVDGRCVHIDKIKELFGYKAREKTFCPMAGMTVAELDKSTFKTRPFQLGYFDIPKEFRVAMGMKARPTEIDGVIFISAHDFTLDDKEPFSALLQYPVFDYYLSYWTKTQLVCKGDGKNAVWYPASPEEDKFNTPRVCKYKECPDFERKQKCKEMGELFFQVQNAPSYSDLWRFSTRSAAGIENIIAELRGKHTAFQGRISYIPMTLKLEKETARPLIDRPGGKKMRVTTEVYRLHIRTKITMEMFMESLKERYKLINAGDELKRLLATGDAKPEPPVPVEQTATDEPENWNGGETIDVESEPVEEKPAPAAAPAAAAPAPAAEKPAPKPAPAAAAGSNKWELLEQDMIKAINDATTLEELRLIPGKFKFDTKIYYPKVASELYQTKGKALKEGGQPAPAAAPAAQKPAPKPAPAAAPAPAAKGAEQTDPHHMSLPQFKKLALVEKQNFISSLLNANPPIIIPDFCEQATGKSDPTTFSDQDCETMFMIYRDTPEG